MQTKIVRFCKAESSVFTQTFSEDNHIIRLRNTLFY